MSEKEEKSGITRRTFLRRSVLGGLGAAAVLGGYPFVEARFYRITRRRIAVPALPAEFDGTTIALIADIHHGKTWGLDFVRSVVEDANGLEADIVALAGDYTFHGRQYIEPCIAELAALRGRLGVYAVLGNHDHWDGAALVRAALAKAQITEVTNTGVWLVRGKGRLRLCGVDDLWEGKQDLVSALGDCGEEEAAVLLCHNPDYVESIRDRRVRLVLSGHTHGGQVIIPFLGAPIVPSRYGQKYLEGLVKTLYTQVYISHGLGTNSPPMRFNCRPELAHLTLVQG